MPVFDAIAAVMEPYPHAPLHSDSVRHGARRGDAILNAAEYFDVLGAVPRMDRVLVEPDSAWRAFAQWAEANAALLDRYPGAETYERMANDVRRAKARNAVRAIEPLIAGTWRMRASIDGGEAREFYVRTRDRASDAWLDRGATIVRDDPALDPPTPDGYALLGYLSLDPAALHAECARNGNLRQGYLHVVQPRDDEPRNRWRGWIGAEVATSLFRADSAWSSFAQQAFSEWSARYNTHGRRDAVAEFRLDGPVLRVEQELRLTNGRTFHLTGERLTPEPARGC